MKKEDIKSGMIVKLRNGESGIVIGGMIQTFEQLAYGSRGRLRDVDDLTDDLSSSYNEDYDIMEVYEINKDSIRPLNDLLRNLPPSQLNKLYKRFEIPKPGTKVKVGDFEDMRWEEATFIAHVPHLEYPFVVYIDGLNVASSYRYMEII